MRIQTHRVSATGEVPSLDVGDPERCLVLAFGPSSLVENASVIADLSAKAPGAHLLGCSTAGEILDTEVRDDTLTVAVVHFDKTRLGSACAPVACARNSFAAGAAIASQLDRPDLRGVLVLSDGLNVNGSDLVRGLQANLSSEVVVTGGLAGDGDRFERTWVIADGEASTKVVSAVGLYGDSIEIGHGSRGGWDIFGPDRQVTRAEGNVLYELDGKPALALYKDYLGDRAAGLPATGLLFPLNVLMESGERVVRTILSVDDDEQSMTFAGDIPQGSLAQLMRADFDRLVEAAALAAQETQCGGPTLSIAISCVGRRLILGERTEDELEATLEGLPEGTRQIGFYSYGEISPVAGSSCELHNQTMTLTTLRET